MKHLKCACGVVIQGSSDEELLTAVETHLDESHAVVAHATEESEGRPISAQARKETS
jgi:predicted small metal-binding protein